MSAGTGNLEFTKTDAYQSSTLADSAEIENIFAQLLIRWNEMFISSKSE